MPPARARRVWGEPGRRSSIQARQFGGRSASTTRGPALQPGCNRGIDPRHAVDRALSLIDLARSSARRRCRSGRRHHVWMAPPGRGDASSAVGSRMDSGREPDPPVGSPLGGSFVRLSDDDWLFQSVEPVVHSSARSADVPEVCANVLPRPADVMTIRHEPSGRGRSLSSAQCRPSPVRRPARRPILCSRRSARSDSPVRDSSR
jgi:hypothetical protein